MNTTDLTACYGDTLIAVGRHLVANPHLPLPTRYGTYGDPDVAAVADLLAWAKTINEPVIRVSPRLPLVGLTAPGFSVYAEDDGDIQRWANPLSQDWTPVTLAQLAAYVAAGTVEHAGEVCAGV